MTMTVQRLIAELQKMPPRSRVVVSRDVYRWKDCDDVGRIDSVEIVSREFKKETGFGVILK